jgi:hypothetical protein
LGGIKPLGSWHSASGSGTASVSIEISANKNLIPVLAVDSFVASSISSQGELHTIKFSALWADTEQYFDHTFLLCGTVKV